MELLPEEPYRESQELGNFDSKASSWAKTPSGIRELGGALFCHRRSDVERPGVQTTSAETIGLTLSWPAARMKLSLGALHEKDRGGGIGL